MWTPREETKTTVPVPVLPPALERTDERRMSAWIGRAITVKGDVISDEDLTIDGRVEGTIALGARSLTIGAGASVQAHLNAHTITISGAVKGNVTATERIDIRETGSVDGDLRAPRVAVRDGAVLHGRVDTVVSARDEKQEDLPIAV
jgi:cytoskeletal protein CcmA (bactofilin family)